MPGMQREGGERERGEMAHPRAQHPSLHHGHTQSAGFTNVCYISMKGDGEGGGREEGDDGGGV